MLLLLLVILICVFWLGYKETFSQDKKRMDFMRGLQRFLTNDTQYSDYLKFITKYKEYSKLESVDTYIILRQLKDVGELSFENIMKFME
jgi:hypothetical protein